MTLLKYCGFDLCTAQSGQFRGTTRLSKRGNARLRYAFWMAGTVAIRMQQNSLLTVNLVEGSALLPREIDAPDRSQQAHVTASHSTNARVRSRRW